MQNQPLKVLPIHFRLNAITDLRGRGVTIAFLDSGFYAHPDLTKPRNRILKYVNLVGPSRDSDLEKPDVSSWHGMMTSVVGAGNGHLSDGLFRGIASEANLVLVKVGSASRIKQDDIARGLRWVTRNRRRFDIRVVNISCGGDEPESYLTGALSRAAEEATRAGLVVVAAAGNAGGRPGNLMLPPASAPSVITVGGLDDKNRIDFSSNDMYHSSYGPTLDGLQKPEIIAPGIWIAAPILPGTSTAAQARLLAELESASDDQLQAIILANPGIDTDLDHAAELDTYLLRQLIWIKLRDNNVISGHYKHVDGTSFAAPIVSSVAAQMIEARPGLTPNQIKFALIKTARRLPNIEPDRQGWGVVSPREAVLGIIE
jgi:serine protease AprX